MKGDCTHSWWSMMPENPNALNNPIHSHHIKSLSNSLNKSHWIQSHSIQSYELPLTPGWYFPIFPCSCLESRLDFGLSRGLIPEAGPLGGPRWAPGFRHRMGMTQFFSGYGMVIYMDIIWIFYGDLYGYYMVNPSTLWSGGWFGCHEFGIFPEI